MQKLQYMIQSAYLEQSRLKIPMLFMHDAIHGYKTIFPIPLALSCSWDEKILENVAVRTASELRAAGIHVNFSPMVDLVRDSRWEEFSSRSEKITSSREISAAQ